MRAVYLWTCTPRCRGTRARTAAGRSARDAHNDGGDATSCSLCPSGQYQDKAGQESCPLCTTGYTFRPVIKCTKCIGGYELRPTCWSLSDCRSGFTGCQPINDSEKGVVWNAPKAFWGIPPATEDDDAIDIAPLLDGVLGNEI